MKFKVEESVQKLRGGYYTPDRVALFLARWAMSRKPKTVLEPGCGDGAFLRALHTLNEAAVSFRGIELDQAEASKALAEAGKIRSIRAEILNQDFVAWAAQAEEQYDAVLGNPPYVRYQYVAESQQGLARQICERYRLGFSKCANLWVPFLVASVGLLAPGGRLAMVVATELLNALYAAPLRAFLSTQCSQVLIIDPVELLFDKTQQGTILLMAEKKTAPTNASKGVCIISAKKGFLSEDPGPFFADAAYRTGEILERKWTQLLLSSHELSVLEEVRRRPTIRRFEDIATVDAGILTGADDFFIVGGRTIRKYDLSGFALPILSKSTWCPGVVYDAAQHAENAANGLPCALIHLVDPLPQRAQEYVAWGEQKQLHLRYKCRIRDPWYSVPSISTTPIGLVKRAHNYHRLFRNSFGACTTTTAYRIRVLALNITTEQLAYCWVNSLTALTAEIQGRSYGGGVLELVPSEIEKLLVPVVESPGDGLDALDKKVRSGMSAELLREQDRFVLRAAGLTDGECRVIHEAWDRMRRRRQRK